MIYNYTKALLSMGLCVAVQVTADEASPDCWPGLAPGIKGGLQKF